MSDENVFPEFKFGITPKRLRSVLPNVPVNAACDPQCTVNEILAMRGELFSRLCLCGHDIAASGYGFCMSCMETKQTIEFTFGTPLCAVSRSYKVYPAKNIKSFRGYLSKFEPAGFFVEGDQPEATITIKFNTDPAAHESRPEEVYESDLGEDRGPEVSDEKRTLHVWEAESTARMMWRAAGSPENEKHVGCCTAMIGVNFHRIVMHEGWNGYTETVCRMAWAWFQESVLTRRYDRSVAVEFAGAGE